MKVGLIYTSTTCELIAESTWKKMSAAEQKIVQEVATSSADYDRQLNKQQTEDLASALEDKGMQVNYPDLTAFSLKINNL